MTERTRRQGNYQGAVQSYYKAFSVAGDISLPMTPSLPPELDALSPSTTLDFISGQCPFTSLYRRSPNMHMTKIQ